MTLALGILLGFLLTIILGNVAAYRSTQKFKKKMMLEKVDAKKVCKGQHIWMEAGLTTGKGINKCNVCRVCGFVSGTDLMAPQEMIDMVEEQNKMLAIEQKLQKEFIDEEDNKIKEFFSEEIKNGLSFDKLLELHSAGSTFEQRFAIYMRNKSKEIEKEMSRGDA